MWVVCGVEVVAQPLLADVVARAEQRAHHEREAARVLELERVRRREPQRAHELRLVEPVEVDEVDLDVEGVPFSESLCSRSSIQ